MKNVNQFILFIENKQNLEEFHLKDLLNLNQNIVLKVEEEEIQAKQFDFTEGGVVINFNLLLKEPKEEYHSIYEIISNFNDLLQDLKKYFLNAKKPNIKGFKKYVKDQKIKELDIIRYYTYLDHFYSNNTISKYVKELKDGTEEFCFLCDKGMSFFECDQCNYMICNRCYTNSGSKFYCFNHSFK